MSCTTNSHVMQLFFSNNLSWCDSKERMTAFIRNWPLSCIKDPMKAKSSNNVIWIRSTPKRAMSPTNPACCNTNCNIISQSRAMELMRVLWWTEWFWLFDSKVGTINADIDMRPRPWKILSKVPTYLTWHWWCLWRLTGEVYGRGSRQNSSQRNSEE